MDVEPGRDRYGAGRRPPGPRQSGGDGPLRHQAARHDAVGFDRARHGQRGRDFGERKRPRRPDHGPLTRPSTSPPAAGQRLTFAYVFAHDARSTTSDRLRAIVERSDGTKVEVFRVSGRAADVDGVWRTASISMDRFAGTRVRIRFEAVDGGSNNLVEVEVDDVRITVPS